MLAMPALGQDTGHPQERPTQDQNASDAAQGQPADQPAVEAPSALPPIAPAEPSGENHDDRAQPEENAKPNEPFESGEPFYVWGDTLAQWIMAVAGVAAILISVWAVFLLKQTLRATRDAITEAEKATAAAEETVAITRDTAQRQLRAYIVGSAEITWQKAHAGANKQIVGYNFTIGWKNCGVTPARRCHARASLGVFDGLIQPDFDYHDKAAPTITEKSHVGPGQVTLLKVGGLSLSDAAGTEHANKHVYIWSWFEYDDIFGETRRRTEICYELRISEKGTVCTPTVASPFNGADADCHHQPKT